MLSRDILVYRKIRYELRAYMCYLFTQNIQNFIPSTNLKSVLLGIEKIKDEINAFDSIYVLDAVGNEINPQGITCTENFADRAYYYEAVREGKCIITNPYPTMETGKLIVTASYPVYDQNHKLLYIVCIDLSLKTAINISAPSKFSNTCSQISTIIYGLLSFVLTLVCLSLFSKGVLSLYIALGHFKSFNIDEIFKSIIQLTLALAIFDLVKAIFEAEVLGKNTDNNSHALQHTMVRFLGSIIIALAIESLMLVFKFAISEPDKILYAVYLIAGVAILITSLSIYVKFAYLPSKEKNT
ncbi:PDC sensor domain-containing protein [Helicobacter anatolicus]|uniref:PDC sensor domain-containing protein n=1 Tax=Helicobacter anatolicus TaxID=2905874 RepID=UPI001E5DD93C|nr:PDC sensor domain-containing protein [Helicobacter anatolicus]MCE3038800.1 PDC sensor domain-containing protein [Helicobacter anatolicus]